MRILNFDRANAEQCEQLVRHAMLPYAARDVICRAVCTAAGTSGRVVFVGDMQVQSEERTSLEIRLRPLRHTGSHERPKLACGATNVRT